MMRIGLINIEPTIFNTAYMQLAGYYRARGNTVDWWSPLMDRQFDHVFCSSIFTFTDKSEVPDRAICGGTGFDVSSRLSREIENAELDYSIYPKCRTSYIWFSRGCIRNCPWCIVPAKEGKIQSVEPKNLNPNGRYITVQDNNFFANSKWRYAINQLKCWDQPVDFQGVDVRLLNEEKCLTLLKLRHHKQIKIAWDDPNENLMGQMIRVTRFIPFRKLMCYVLIGFNSTEQQDLERVETLRVMRIDPFVMPYDKNDLYQRAFARWVNNKAIFKKVPWQDYSRRVSRQEAAGCGWAPAKGG